LGNEHVLDLSFNLARRGAKARFSELRGAHVFDGRRESNSQAANFPYGKPVLDEADGVDMLGKSSVQHGKS
jgi:hypothetical protein